MLSPKTSLSSTVDAVFEEDPLLAYNHVFPDFTIDEINDMNMSHLKKQKNGDDSASLDSTASLSLSRMALSHSISTATSSGRKNVWSLMTRRRENGFDFDEEDEEEYLSLNRLDHCKAALNGFLFELRHCLQNFLKYPYIYISTALVFAALTAVSLIVVKMICRRNYERVRYETQWEALETATWFSEIFAKSLIPLRSLQQAVVHSEYFKQLPYEIGNYGEPGSAESMYGMKSSTVQDYRNVTGICDNAEMIEKFHEIVEGITDNFGYDGIIVNYRLAPYGVFCVADPLVNTKDFSAESPLDSRGIIGWDPLNSLNTRWGQVIRRTYFQETEMDIFGPTAINGVQMFCSHLSVPFADYNLNVDDKAVPTWGFVMHFINWSRLKEQSGIDERFKKKGLHYRLTRTDQKKNPETGMMMDYDVTIAHNMNDHEYDEHGDGHVHQHCQRVSVSVMTPNGEWVMHVYHCTHQTALFVYIRIATVLCCFIISTMFGLVLLERHLHKMLLYKIMPRDAIQKLNRGQTVVERYNVVTIFFSDIVGFTSLAGEMTPIQVMKMLNELYLQFDRIVEKHGVYKVETIGDAYMVVGGAPDRIPAPEAAQRVALFALEAIEFVKNFRTSDGDRIFIRAGIASGPVVAGVVGQAMPRYCFFGDTVNLASRMESNSTKMKIQCSDYTCRLLHDSPDFSFDLRQRVENGVTGIHVKGKGITQTWWINHVKGLNLTTSQHELDVSQSPSCASDNVIQSIALSKQDWLRLGLPDSPLVAETSDVNVMINRVTAILEHRLSILIAKVHSQASLSNAARKELRKYVEEIASMYNAVHFHNFEHAVHVTTSMNKIIDTIVESAKNEKEEDNGSISRNIWKNAYLHFAMIFACLIHDVEHTGRSNKILASGNHSIAKRFSGPSAERNSIKTSLELLLRPKYKNLRKTLFPDIKAKFEFGRCIFWAILCTDIASPERVQNCKTRYTVVHSGREIIEAAKASNLSAAEPFYDPELCPLLPFLTEVVEYLKITQKEIKENPEQLIICQEGLENCVLVEHLTQVSDVAHLMQSWEVFLKYNLRLYKELMACHTKGLMPDPSSDWAIGQIGFLTNYVIPLALRSEVILGSEASALNLSRNAMANMNRWEVDGEVVTEIFITGCQNNELEKVILKNSLEVGGQMHLC